MLEGAACGPSKGRLTLAAASAGHRTVPTVTANGPSALGPPREMTRDCDRRDNLRRLEDFDGNLIQ